jgi:hypothetical protein
MYRNHVKSYWYQCWTKCKNSSQEYTLGDILGDVNLVNISRIHTILTCWGCTRVQFVNDI